MEIIATNIPNLAFKKRRLELAEGTVVCKAPTTFDAKQWASTANNPYGPNYYIDSLGKVYEVIPETHHAIGEKYEVSKIGIMVEEGKLAEESCRLLIESINVRYNREESLEVPHEPEVSSDRKKKIKNKKK